MECTRRTCRTTRTTCVRRRPTPTLLPSSTWRRPASAAATRRPSRTRASSSRRWRWRRPDVRTDAPAGRPSYCRRRSSSSFGGGDGPAAPDQPITVMMMVMMITTTTVTVMTKATSIIIGRVEVALAPPLNSLFLLPTPSVLHSIHRRTISSV